MNVILSSRLPLHDAQLSALHQALNKETLSGTKVLFIADAASDPAGNLPEWTNRDIDKFKALDAEVTPYLLSQKPQSDIEQQVLTSDILFFEGGSTPKLLKAIKDSNLMSLVNSDALDSKIWFGISAGGCVLSPNCYSSCERWFMKDPGEQPITGLTTGDFYFIPHYKSPDFPPNTEENLPHVQEKLAGHQAIIGTDACVVTGTLKNNRLSLDQELHDAYLLTN